MVSADSRSWESLLLPWLSFGCAVFRPATRRNGLAGFSLDVAVGRCLRTYFIYSVCSYISFFLGIENLRSRGTEISPRDCDKLVVEVRQLFDINETVSSDGYKDMMLCQRHCPIPSETHCSICGVESMVNP